MTIELPLPHVSLHPNSRPHWGTKARMVKLARTEAALVAKLVKPKSCPWDEATIHMTFYMPRKRDHDGLVAWMKASFDGLQDSGVVKNDSAFRIGTIEQVIQKKVRKVVLRIDNQTEGTNSHIGGQNHARFKSKGWRETNDRNRDHDHIP